MLRAERVADDGWLPQCTVDFEYASCFPCRSTDAAAVLLEPVLGEGGYVPASYLRKTGSPEERQELDAEIEAEHAAAWGLALQEACEPGQRG